MEAAEEHPTGGNILYTKANELRWEGSGQAWAGYSEFKRGETERLSMQHSGPTHTNTHTSGFQICGV